MADMYYTEDHEWVKFLEDRKVRIGITEFAQDELGDIVYVELPEVDDTFDEGEEFGTVESVKSVSGIMTPVAGTVVAINETLEDEPELVNDDATGEGWLVEIETGEDVDFAKLLSKEEYDALTEAEE